MSSKIILILTLLVAIMRAGDTGPFHDLEKIITGDGRSDTERAGDLIQIVLPSYGLYKTYVNRDRVGRTELWKSLLATFLVTYTLKYSIKKERPNGDNFESFPSGHTSIAFSGATFLNRKYGRGIGIPAYALATFVGYSRVYAEKHYWTDVIAGALVGIVATVVLTKPGRNWSLYPYLNEDSSGLRLSIIL